MATITRRSGQLIYNSAATLDRLRADANFTYVPNVVVDRVEEHGATVRLRTRALHDSEVVWRSGERVCLACGPIATSRILMASLDL